MIFAVLPNTIEHPLTLIDQHRKTGKGVIEGLSSLCEARDHISLLRPLSNPGLQARQTKPRIGLHRSPNIGIPRREWLDSDNVLNRIRHVVHHAGSRGSNETRRFWQVGVASFRHRFARRFVVVGIGIGPLLHGKRHRSRDGNIQRTLGGLVVLQALRRGIRPPHKMALHRPSEGQLSLIQRTNELAESTDRCLIEILTGQKPGRDSGIVLYRRHRQHFHHQRL